MSAGFPYISITKERKYLAYECCLLYEVITKRVEKLQQQHWAPTLFMKQTMLH